jgi:sugar phosphate isomerase/epimerase
MAARTGLWWGTIEGASLLELAAAASGAGFTDISVTPAMYAEARAAGHSDRDLRTRLADLGVSVTLIDPLISGLPGIPSPDAVGRRFRSTFEYREDDCYRAAEGLGAGGLNVAHYLGAPTEVSELTDRIAAIAGRAAERDLDVLVEFMPDGSIPDLATAAAIVAGVGSPSCRVMFDTWHHWRCGGGTEDVRALPPGSLGALQLSDALDDVHGSWGEPPTRDRLLPGDGVIPLAEIVRIGIANRGDVPIGLEVFNRALTELPFEERAARAKKALDRLLASAVVD